jgi:hypothetical protein
VAADGESYVAFTAAQAGETELILDAPGSTFTPANRVKVTVAAPVSISENVVLPAGFQGALGLIYGAYGYLPSSATILTIKSMNPSRLVLSRDPAIPGSASITLDLKSVSNPQIWAQALAGGGDTPLELAVSGHPAVTQIVRLTSPAIALDSALTGPVLLSPGGVAALFLTVVGADSGRRLVYRPNPQTGPVSVRITSANPSVAAVSPAAIQIGSAASYQFAVTALAEGTTTLRIESASGPPIAQANMPFEVTVRGKQLPPRGPGRSRVPPGGDPHPRGRSRR